MEPISVYDLAEIRVVLNDAGHPDWIVTAGLPLGWSMDTPSFHIEKPDGTLCATFIQTVDKAWLEFSYPLWAGYIDVGTVEFRNEFNATPALAVARHLELEEQEATPPAGGQSKRDYFRKMLDAGMKLWQRV